MGAWISESYQTYASKLPREVMETYRESLATAETAASTMQSEISVSRPVPQGITDLTGVYEDKAAPFHS